ncbi:hypothetical protein QYF36_023853 [Acer negundo]|nr:hypothetical protein QYF36_023853 [Acer negundo]
MGVESNEDVLSSWKGRLRIAVESAQEDTSIRASLWISPCRTERSCGSSFGDPLLAWISNITSYKNDAASNSLSKPELNTATKQEYTALCAITRKP